MSQYQGWVSENREYLRRELLKEVLKFVTRARNIQGVERIALIGSLTTNKSVPKDADVLVTVTDEINLHELASLGRKLKGAGQCMGSGADIFLANHSGQYIGRTCQYKKCHPRVRCTGRSCGIKPYLCDDFDEVVIDSQLIETPPVVLLPDVIRNINVPGDVEEMLIEPLENKAARG